ncbi:hypothetical protein [Altererythrobacter sp. Z27]|uniref:hypothetical protein n=1 Tax=Altererythrobacter sp. Z27 TaxID=3461147 RepID=UPI004043CBC9
MLEYRLAEPVVDECSDPCCNIGETCDSTMLALFETPGARLRADHSDSDLEFPRRIWFAMGVAYAVFFTGLWLATASGTAATFALVIGILYTLMYFATALVLFRLNPARRRSPFAQGTAPLATWTGPMEGGAVAAQVLAIPFALATFGAGFMLVRAAAF